MQQKRPIRIFTYALIAYLAIGIAVYLFQDTLFFHPVPVSMATRYDFGVPYREVNLPFEGDANINIIQFSADSTAGMRGAVLYFHGNRRNIGWYARHAGAFTKKGYEVWMIDYPGFGKSTGPFQEEVLYSYAQRLYMLARRQYAPDELIIYGRSMGTGIAAWLAERQPARRLILETPYYSFSSLASCYLPVYPVERMIRTRIPTHSYLSQVAMPVSIFHGTSDFVIPYRNAKRLEACLKPGDEFITVSGGGHNDLGDAEVFRRKLDSLLLR